MSDYMISLRAADNERQMASEPRYLKFEGRDDAPVLLSREDWGGAILGEFPPVHDTRLGVTARSGELLFFVHGFNVGLAAARKAHMDMADWLERSGWNGTLVSFDWPSAGLVFAYIDDRKEARDSASFLVRCAIGLLQQMQQRRCRVTVNVMCHSMGGFVVQQAFTWAYQDVPPDWRVGQLIFVAADVDHTVFDADNPSAKAFVQHAGRLTAYCNRYDKALAVSNAKRLELAPRMGRVGLPDDAPSAMCELDCSDLFDKAFPNAVAHLDPGVTHGFYFQQAAFWDDVVLTLAGGLDRAVIPNRGKIDDRPPNRFALGPGTLADTEYKLALGRARPDDPDRPPILA